MDPIAQGLFGGAAALLAVPSSATRATRWWALAVGVAAGMAPDLDVLIRSEANPLLNIQYHRHFTHALAFIPLGALLMAAMFWLLLQRSRWRGLLSFPRVYLYAFLGWATHGVVDATTSYGTHLLWPFSNARTSWSNMSIVEPMVWLLLLVALMLAFSRFARRGLLLGWSLVLLYFGWGAYQWWQIDQAMHQLAAQRGHQIAFSEVKPSLGNLILWRTTYVDKATQQIYVDGFRRGITGQMRFYEGVAVSLLSVQHDLPWLKPDSVQANDVSKFTFFSAGFVALTQQNPPIIGDMRYSMLPNSIKPLWGITLNPEQQQQHVQFGSFRPDQNTSEVRARFWQMLKGQGGEAWPLPTDKS